jgi:hypothetical protein
MITSRPVLDYYEPKLPARVTTDASKAGLGLNQLHLPVEPWLNVEVVHSRRIP